MDAVAALWFTSIIGAVGFTATGFFLARSRMPVADAPSVSKVELASAPIAEAAPAPAPVAALDEPTTLDEPTEPATPELPSAPPPPVATLPPVAPTPSTAPRRDPRREDEEEDTANKTDVLGIDSVRPRRGASATPPPVATNDLEKQLQALRVELRAEVVARDKIEMRARELAIRLSSMSEQMTALRARLAEEQSAARKPASIIPSAAKDARTRLSSRAPGLFAEIDELKNSVARLTAENESLRASALGVPVQTRRPRTRTDLIVPEVLKRMVDRIARLENVRAAAVAEGSGLVLAGSGEFSDALAAFGAYIRDAASRSHRLLPLRTTEEVTVRDSYGLVFSTQVLGRPQAELSLVTLALGDASVAAIRKIVADGVDADLRSEP